MLAAVYRNGKIQLEKRQMPELIHARDAIVKVTMSSICTSDLHIRNGAVPNAKNGVILGHEFVGKIVALGNGIKELRVDDRVSANCITFCGDCYYCQKGFINNCENGGWKLGCKIDGCQAEYVRVPYADKGLNVIPDGVSDESALFVGDILSSGYFGAELAEIKPGDIIAVIGLGPVGLCAAMCAKLYGAKVIGLESNTSRLDFAKSKRILDFGFLVTGDLSAIVESVLSITQKHGADAVIEAAGGKDTLELAWKIARPNAVVALVAMYEETQKIPLPEMYGKNLIFKTGGVDAVHCDKLLQWVADGKLNTDFLITHQVTLDHILDGYRIFEAKENGCLKIAVRPPSE